MPGTPEFTILLHRGWRGRTPVWHAISPLDDVFYVLRPNGRGVDLWTHLRQASGTVPGCFCWSCTQERA